MKIWYRGRIGGLDDCRVSILDHGLLYGDGVFEGIRITAGRVFRLHDHLARLAASARAIGLTLPASTDDIAAIVLATARAHGAREAYVRLLLTRGVGELTLTVAQPDGVSRETAIRKAQYRHWRDSAEASAPDLGNVNVVGCSSTSGNLGHAPPSPGPPR